MNIISYFVIFFLKEIFCFEKIGWLEELSTSTESWGYKHLEEELPPEFSFDDIRLRAFVLREGRMPKRNIKESDNKSLEEEGKKLFKKGKYSLEEEQLFTGHRRLVEEILDNYDPTVHPRRNFRESTRINLSMSLYQILDVDERRQSIVVNVWMVQNWFDEFLDWDPNKFEMINKTIVPYEQIWIPDTVLYNSEEMNKKSTEALMNAIVETGHWRKDGKGATVQLMFPAIYKLSCRMNVRFFPYDQQNCSFIISSWTHDSSTIDYYFERPTVNLLNFAQNDEWTVISFNFQRIEQQFKCCKNPWTMLYAHLVIRRKPLYYIVNLVLPTSIITVVAVTGFFTPSSSSSERDEKLYLGINTLMTMMLMLLMVTNQMPNTSNYVPLMSWYYMGIIGTCVFGTLIATFVLFLHSRKSLLQLPPSWLLKNFLMRRCLWRFVLEPPSDLKEIWAEDGLVKIEDEKENKKFTSKDKKEEQFVLPKGKPLSHESFSHTRQLVSATRQIAQFASKTVGRERRRRETIDEAADFLSKGVFGHRKAELHRLQKDIRSGSRIWVAGGGRPNLRFVKRQKLMRRCAMEWEFLANCVDRCLLAFFACMTVFFFSLLAFYESWIELGLNIGIL